MKAITVEPKKSGTARYEDIAEPDERDGSVLVEAVADGVCGTDIVIVDAILGVGVGGVEYLTGIGSGGVHRTTADVAAATSAVLKNAFTVGSVNANKRHWYKAGQALARADPKWLESLITRRE